MWNVFKEVKRGFEEPTRLNIDELTTELTPAEKRHNSIMKKYGGYPWMENMGDRLKKSYGPQYYVKLGKMGGETKTHKAKGFAASGLAREAGRIGGKTSKRRPKDA